MMTDKNTTHDGAHRPGGIAQQDAAEFDVAVVGGGLAGLVAATTAARGGASVVLLDRRSFGGRARER